jgi:hypothetical protein
MEHLLGGEGGSVIVSAVNQSLVELIFPSDRVVQLYPRAMGYCVRLNLSIFGSCESTADESTCFYRYFLCSTADTVSF